MLPGTASRFATQPEVLNQKFNKVSRNVSRLTRELIIAAQDYFEMLEVESLSREAYEGLHDDELINRIFLTEGEEDPQALRSLEHVRELREEAKAAIKAQEYDDATAKIEIIASESLEIVELLMAVRSRLQRVFDLIRSDRDGFFPGPSRQRFGDWISRLGETKQALNLGLYANLDALVDQTLNHEEERIEFDHAEEIIYVPESRPSTRGSEEHPSGLSDFLTPAIDPR
jgi:hypothetical protein